MKTRFGEPRLDLSVMVMVLVSFSGAAAGERSRTEWICKGNDVVTRLIPPELPGSTATIVETTINRFLKESYARTMPSVTKADGPGPYVVVGDARNNTVLRELTQNGLVLDRSGIGDEGFRLVTHEAGNRRFVIVTANSAAGLKHGCQELVFFRMPATAEGVRVEWPLDVTMKPQFAYRGVYMLPCWAPHDSVASWKRVLRFHSELTINRNWFWLAGFPLLDAYGGEYAGTDLADPDNIDALIELCRQEAMKFYIGGGWFTWHHEKHAGGSIDRGVRYYLDLLERFPGAEGIYLEPSGEGSQVDRGTWQARTDALQRLVDTIRRTRPGFEFAVAIGRFNTKPYREAVHRLTDRHLYWWWCWGDPFGQRALDEHPLVLRWHTVRRMTDYHGSSEPPNADEVRLTGYATSYDPGMGFGNPWNGWGKLGVDHPREFDPRTMPYFSHQYWFRERCWNVALTREQFAARLARRLFDADMPTEAIDHYLRLADLCRKPRDSDEASVAVIDTFVHTHAGRGTSRNRDTIQRMREAVDGVRAHRANAKKR